MQWYIEADRIHRKFVSDKWTPYCEEDKRFLTLALAGEVGELANWIKKKWRGDVVDEIEIVKEMADIRIYLELLAIAYGTNLDKIVELKLEEVKKRIKI